MRDLLELLKEANQEVPTFLETIAREGSGFGGGGRGGGRSGGRGRGATATRDVRSMGGGQRPAYAGTQWGGSSAGGYGGGMGGAAPAYGGGYGGGGMGGGSYGNPSGPSGPGANSWW